MSSTEGQEALRGLCADLKRLHVECTGLTLENLARVCGRSRAQIGAILNGDIRRLPDLDVILGIVGKCASYAVGRQMSLSLSTEEKRWQIAHAAVEKSLASAHSSAPKSIAKDPWVELVRENTGDDVVGQQAMVIAKHLTEQRRVSSRKLKNDPWLDLDLARRIVDHATALATDLLNEDTQLSASETALLLLAPLLHQTTWLKAAANLDIDPLDLSQTGARDQERADFERFLRGRQQQRLVARTTQYGLSDRPAHSAEIGWWLLHRWLDTQAPDINASALPDDIIDDLRLRRVLQEPLLLLVRVFRLSASELGSDERLNLPSEFGGTLGTPGVRVRLVGLLLVVAHSLAIEIATLSSTVVEHLGIPEAVSLTELHETLQNSEWRRDGSELDLWLHADCSHEAVLEALTEHISRTDALLGAVRVIAQNEVTLQPLRALPARACADQLRPALVDGKPLFSVPVARFRLDETRVRELLMGEQLYRDRTLVVRELYQNALDACRYRKARHEFQDKMWGWRKNWTGQIIFKQGVDPDGRHYLSCTDNGVGMSELDLREVFAQAGSRFADRHEFAEEQADWDQSGVEFYPNSRFGIGVMSYFMIADEIEVTTCRMSRQANSPGPVLKVVIAGPGHLFRIKKVAEHGSDPGTEIRLYLRDSESLPSCVRTLRAILGIAEFATQAEHGDTHAKWEPMVFQARERQHWEPEGINAYGRLEPASTTKYGHVTWCEHGGALLVDGIYVQAKGQSHGLAAIDPRGAVINLVGPSAPILTVDRLSVLGDVSECILNLLEKNTYSLLQPDSSLLTYLWVVEIAASSPGIADVITRAAVATGKHLQLGDTEVNIARSGIVELDVVLTESVRPPTLDRIYRIQSWEDSDHILLWRLIALVDGALSGTSVANENLPILPAIPSDNNLLTTSRNSSVHLTKRANVTLGLAAEKASILGRSLSYTLKQLSLLNLSKIDINAQLHVEVDVTDVVLISCNLNGEHPWLPHSKSVQLSHLIAASIQTQIPIEQVILRLKRLDFSVEEDFVPGESLEESDLRIISRNLNSQLPWIERSSPVPVLHIVRAMQIEGRSFSDISSRLATLGFDASRTPSNIEQLETLSPDIAAALIQLYPLSMRTELRSSQIVCCAAKSECPPSKLACFLSDIFVDVDNMEGIPDRLDHKEVELLRALPSHHRLSALEVMEAAEKVEVSIDWAESKLRQLGFSLGYKGNLSASLNETTRRIIKSKKIYTWQDSEVSLLSLITAASTLDLPLDDIAESIRALGVVTPNLEHLPQVLHESDERILRRISSRAFHKPIPLDRPVPLGHLIYVSHMRRMELQVVANRLRTLGYQPPSPNELPDQVSEIEIKLISWQEGGIRHWYDPYETVKIGDLIRASIRCNLGVKAAAYQMAKLGFRIPDIDKELPLLIVEIPMDATD
ncbi:hypothetical protein ACIBCH_40545 [Amycolatopsis thailandensis]|uniref:wHTH domain-containing protein n=1 Tax=Amycolatopsis thailandensis TaxID=589330 RepID=UPI00379AD6EC